MQQAEQHSLNQIPRGESESIPDPFQQKAPEHCFLSQPRADICVSQGCRNGLDAQTGKLTAGSGDCMGNPAYAKIGQQGVQRSCPSGHEYGARQRLWVCNPPESDPPEKARLFPCGDTPPDKGEQRKKQQLQNRT